MKKSLIILISLIGFGANASYYQNHCGNAEGTVQTTSGHSSNDVTLTERVFQEGKYQETKLKFKYADVNLEFSGHLVLDSQRRNSCAGDAGAGIAESTTISYQKASITKSDGSDFSENTVGVSQDKKSVETHLICKRYINSMTPCN